MVLLWRNDERGTIRESRIRARSCLSIRINGGSGGGALFSPARVYPSARAYWPSAMEMLARDCIIGIILTRRVGHRRHNGYFVLSSLVDSNCALLYR